MAMTAPAEILHFTFSIKVELIGSSFRQDEDLEDDRIYRQVYICRSSQTLLVARYE